MSYPVYSVAFPTDLAEASNGRLTYQLVTINFPGRGLGRVHRQTAQAWAALCAGCLQSTGVVLSVVSLGDAYRSYDSQVAVFLQRYLPYYIAGSTSSKYYNGRWYWLRLGFSQVATPGQSNHGWGLAIDVCEWRSGRCIGISASPAWRWLLANAPRYGFSWESQSEPWHIRLCTGDFPTQAVRDFYYVAPPPVPPPPGPPNPVYDDDDMPTLYRDSRFNNVFLVNGDVTTISPALYQSLINRGVPVVTDVHDQSLISFMRKSLLKMPQMVSSGTGGFFAAPADLQ